MGRPAVETLWTERGRDVAITEGGQEGIGFSLDHPGWGGLTFRRPTGCAGDPISGFSNGMPVFDMNVLPGALSAVNYDHFPVSGEGHTYHDLSTSNSGAQYRSDDVDIGCGSEGRPVVTNLEAGEWLTYTVHVPTTGSYDVTLRYKATAAGASARVSFGDTYVTSDAALPDTSGAFETHAVASGAMLRAGVQALRISIAAVAAGFELEGITVD
jgi:hypothetical protein